MIFRAFQNVIVTGQNPEAADYDNPQGYVFATRWFVEAISDIDAIYIHNSEHRSPADAEATAKRFTDNPPDVVTSDDFCFDRFAYGSIGYQQHGGEEALIQFERFAQH